VATTLGAIGVVHDGLGSYATALEYHERALQLREAMNDRAGVAGSLLNIGAAHYGLGSYARSAEYFERARKTMEELGDRAGAAGALRNIGSAHRSMGSYAQALEDHERALKVLEESGDRLGVAGGLGNVGNVHYCLGSYTRALEYHERARAMAAELGAVGVEVRNLWGIASARLALDQAPEAARRVREAVGKLALMEGRLSEELGASARERWSGLRDVGVSAAMRVGDASEAAFFLESGRAAGLLEALGGRAALRAAAIPAALADEEQDARASLAAARARQDRANRTGDRAEIQAARDEVARAEAGMLDVTAEIQRTAKARANVAYPKAAPLAEIRRRLGNHEALVLYAVMPEESVALVATRDAARLVRLGPGRRIEELCGSFQAEGRAALRDAVMEPLALPATVRRILVSPDGPLSYVPFVLLARDREIAYVPSGTTYDVLCDERDQRGEGVLALGDPDYGIAVEPHEAGLFRGGRLAPLPATRAEAKAIGDVVLLGADATPAGLLSEVAKRPRWRAVHIACHGLVDPGRPLLSSLALAGGDLATLDVFRSRIPADLVVLSACETAKGKVFRSEGVVGFVRAFMFAGAPRVIVSLWKVDDDATRALMERFYERWKGGAAAALALKEAQEHVAGQEKWKHPRFWAAWQLWGLPE
jgi:CHAT domain-containing protein